jgi:chain length determinant protein EpsF
MSLAEFLSILRARRWPAILILALTFGSAVAVSLMLPKKYTATSSLIFDLARPDPLAAAAYWSNPSPSFLSTQVDVIRSERVALHVVRALRMAEDAKARQEWVESTRGQGSLEIWLANGIQKMMEVVLSRDSNVIKIVVRANKPELAAMLANTLARSYLDVSLDLRVDPARQYSAFFDSRAKQLRADLERAQSRLSAYQREKGIIATDDRLDFETQQLNQLSMQLTALQALSAESSSRQAQAVGGSGDRLQEVINNPMLAGLRGDLTRAEGRLQELNARLGDNHPQVVEAKANIAALRSRLDADTRRVTGSVGVTNTINRAREGEIRAALEAQRAKVLRMKTVRDEGSVLYRDVENAQRAYDGVLARLNQTNLESHATQSNANLLAEATAPLFPSSPKLLVNGALSLAVGLLLAVGAAVALELSDRRIRTVDEVTRLLGLPVIGTLPKHGAKAMFGRRSTGLIGHQLVGTLPPPVRGA